MLGLGLLGCGGFGAVELYEHKVTKESFAMKGLSKGYRGPPPSPWRDCPGDKALQFAYMYIYIYCNYVKEWLRNRRPYGRRNSRPYGRRSRRLYGRRSRCLYRRRNRRPYGRRFCRPYGRRNREVDNSLKSPNRVACREIAVASSSTHLEASTRWWP